MTGHRRVSAGASVAIAMLTAAWLALGFGCSRAAHRPRIHVPPPPPDPSALSTGAAGAGPVAGAPSGPSDITMCAHAGCIAPGPIPHGATCHELINHADGDRALPYLVQPGEQVTCFYYDVPWTEPVTVVAWQTEIDSPAMLEWRLYTHVVDAEDGTTANCFGGGESQQAELLLAHLQGGNDVLMPPGVGLRAPAPGTRMVLQWHHMRLGGVPLPDASKVRLCTLPVNAVQRVASLTVLGSENAGTPQGVPPGYHDVEAACPITSEQPVRLLMLAPHMNRLGRHAGLSVLSANGALQRILDLDFAYDRQLMRATKVDLRRGDRLTTRCSYDNDTGSAVPFGQLFNFEQCFLFAIAEPAGALDNFADTSLNATNVCW